MALLSLEAIHKEFPGVVALDGVCLDLEPGHVHALAGENGAGKSTLINIISGVIQPDRGRILRDGREVSIDSPRRARRLGIAVVHQEAAMFPDLTVAENIALPPGLPRWPGGWVRNRCLRGAARQHLAAVGAELLARIREVVYSRSTALSTRHLSIIHGTLGDHAGITGAAAMAIEHVLSPAAVNSTLAVAGGAR